MNTLIIAKREFVAFFSSSVTYVVGTVFLFITGLVFVSTVVIREVASLAQLFQVIGIVLLLLAPLLTMRLLSEEARSGTLELLLTTPIRDWEVVLGKFLATLSFFLVLLLPTLYYLFLLTHYDNPDVPVILSGYLGVILAGAMFISIGILTSAMSANQMMAAILGVVFSLTFWLAGVLANIFSGFLGHLFAYLSIQEHFFDFVRGLIVSTHIIYFLSITVASLFLATRVLEVRRWR